MDEDKGRDTDRSRDRDRDRTREKFMQIGLISHGNLFKDV
jgi:hypothetical protein